MSTKRKKPESAEGGPFGKSLRFVLNNFSNLATLEEESPLAQPYFLGESLKQPAEIDATYPRAEILRHEILQAAAQFWGDTLPSTQQELIAQVDKERREIGNKGKRYYYLLLEIKYFRQLFRPRATPEAKNEQEIIDFLGVGRSPFFRHLKTARAELARALLERIRPTFRLEQPPLPENLFGRKRMLKEMHQALESGQNIAISGPSGSGKTALSANLLTRYAGSPVFWYTFRKGINIQVDALLFSIGTFLHQQTQSALWLQLVADRGEIKNIGLAFGLLKGDLARLTDEKIIFCFDDIEQLSEEANPHLESIGQIRSIIETLIDVTPCQVILIGQAPLFATETHITLANFSQNETVNFLAEHQIILSTEQYSQLGQLFAGNPRLLNLLTTLIDTDQPFEKTLATLLGKGSVQAVFNHVWQQLSRPEKELMLQLSVFTEPAPTNLCPPSILERLKARKLLQQDGFGGVSLIQFWRDQLYNDRRKLPVETRDRYHMAAASALSDMGDYTGAFHHLVKAGEYGTAIQLWFPHRHTEVLRGYAQTARAIIDQIPTRHLSKEESNALALSKAELAKLAGNLTDGLEIIQKEDWNHRFLSSIDAVQLKAQFLDELGYSDQALTDLSTARTLIQKQTIRQLKLHTRAAFIYAHKSFDIDKAKQEMEIIKIESDYLAARISIFEGEFEEAKAILTHAITQAKKHSYHSGLSKLTFTLIEALSRLNQIDEALELTNQMAAFFQKTGDVLMAERIKSYLSNLYSLKGNLDKSIESNLASLTFFEKSQMPYWIAAISSNLSDDYLEIGDLDSAEKYAQKVLSSEEPHSIPFALYNLGKISMARGHIERADHHFTEGLNLAQQNGDRYIEAFHLRGLGEVAAGRQKTGEAAEKYRLAKEMFAEMGVAPEIEMTEKLIETLVR